MTVENPHTVVLKFQAADADDTFELLSDELQVSGDIAPAFAPSFREIAPLLHFVLESQEKGIPRVKCPVKRKWNGLKLVEERIAGNDDTLTVRWETGGDWEVNWDRKKPRERIASANRGEDPNFGGHCVARRQDPAALDLRSLAVTFQGGPTPQLVIAGAVHFRDCPPLKSDAAVTVNGSPAATTHIGTDRSVRIVLPVPEDWPETLQLGFTLKGTEPVVSGTIELRVPTRLRDFELSTEEGRFTDVLLVDDVPARARFIDDGYTPETITLRFVPQRGDAPAAIVPAFKLSVTDDKVVYRLELSEPVTLAFPNGVPGSMLVFVEHQLPPEPAGTVKLVPRLIRGHWEQRLEGGIFSVASTELDLSAVVGFASPFDSIGDHRAPPVPPPARNGVITASNRPIVASRVVLTRGAAIPIDDGWFTPGYPENPLDLWKQTPLNLGPRGNPRKFRIASTKATKELFQRKTAAVRGIADVLELGENTFALVAILLDARKKFGAPIPNLADVEQPAGSVQSFGVFFRGFCLSARLRRVHDSVSPGGLLIWLDKPLPIDGSVKPPVSAFLPIRAAASSTRDQFAFWIPPAEPVFVDVLDGVPEHKCVGYVYSGRDGGDGLYWARYPELQPAPLPLLYTFDDHLIEVTPKSILFRGWWLPGGSSRTFPGTSDSRSKTTGFGPYSFHFARGAMDPFVFHVGKDGITESGQGKWLTEKEQAAVKAKILSLHADGSSSQESFVAEGGTTVSLVFRQRDKDGDVVVMASPVVDSHEVGLYSLV